ncbi:TM0106 family RecB-like putative nuclease [Bradyrhizobium sp. INPA03-11B]|uniref:TM0106 family RecB-like putative nuclease n=1 Tax=Bradyrhizobium sp. INPA03-11B TaxID=418598 RepID=UPI00338FED31
MQKVGTTLVLSAHDLVGNLYCAHLTNVDLKVAHGLLPKPARWDPLLDILRERGRKHEQAFLGHLEANGFEPFVIEGVDVTDVAVTQTREAMQAGRAIIVQAALRDQGWVGRADILRRVEAPSDLGDWSYEIIDTKLARETKGGTVLQLCLYAQLLGAMQGVEPEFVYFVAPWSDFHPQQFRVADYMAFFRKAQRAAQTAVDGATDIADSVYPDPKTHCDVCRWEPQCDARRRADDHLCLVANVSALQMNELRTNGIATAKTLSTMPVPLPWKPKRGSVASYIKAREQARVQVEARETGTLRYELLDLIPGTGLYLLPSPTRGDVFFDIEGDPFIGEGGFEYLFGYCYRDAVGRNHYEAQWAFNRASEKVIFETFMDFVTARRSEFPQMHVYHYAPYEPGALKRLMGRYATRQTEVDDLLRGKVMVDLYAVVRNAIRAGVESYSIKKLEPFYAFTRVMPLQDANLALAAIQAGLELDDAQSIDETARQAVAAYNRDDCNSTAALRDWLEHLRAEAIANGAAIERPVPGGDGPSDDIAKHEARINELIERLTHDVPIDPVERTPEQHGRFILAHSLDWHRREEKANWWEYFRLAALTAEDLLDEKAGLGSLEFVRTVERSKQGIPTDRYRFASQDTDIREEADLHVLGGEKFGSVIAISQDDRTIDIKKSKRTADIHPDSVFEHTHIPTKEQQGSLLRLGTYVADHGIEGLGEFQAARDLLLRLPPRLGPAQLHIEHESTLEGALRITPALSGGVLPIQGPPGTGKSFTGAHMICRLLKDGKRVGITANSHKVIRNLIDKAIKVALEAGQAARAGHRCPDKGSETDPVRTYLDNPKAIGAISSGEIAVLGGTPFFWAREDVANSVDVLFVDEAAQMSLANVLAVSQAAPQMILLGDPQQLDQPMQGSHPDGTGVSALHHILAGRQTIVPDQGLFLEETWRMHPAITIFNSELFYETKLHAVPKCAQQNVTSTGVFFGTGLRYVPVSHTGNQSSSIEEAEEVARIVTSLLSSRTQWTDRDGKTKELELSDIIIIAPYNAQVFEVQQRIPGAHVGTVDKFQGQEAAIAIYSLATSSYADAPRGMEFLYSANRLNVAISRAKCLAIMVASPAIFEAECKTPRQMQLANAFCRYLELAQTITL